VSRYQGPFENQHWTEPAKHTRPRTDAALATAIGAKLGTLIDWIKRGLLKRRKGSPWSTAVVCKLLRNFEAAGTAKTPTVKDSLTVAEESSVSDEVVGKYNHLEPGERLKALQGDEKELDLAERRGQLVSLDSVRDGLQDLGQFLSLRLSAIVTRLPEFVPRQYAARLEEEIRRLDDEINEKMKQIKLVQPD
jgi:phage terminase Nu1 subunit (DNA packaging protein)